MFHQKKTMDEEIFDTLDRIMEIAESSQDAVLLGFAHYHLADSVYAFEIDYSKFRHHMSRAVFYLITCDEDALLTRAYNYLGIDALNNAAFDVAYFHFMNALNTCEHLDDPYLLSIVNNNIGQIYARMGSNEKALEYVRLGNEQQLRSPKDDVYYYQNTINGYFSEGMLNLALGRIDRVREIERTIQALVEESDVSVSTNTVIPIAFLRLELALIDNDAPRIEQYRDETFHIISDAHRIFDFLTDIRDLCMFLINHEQFEIVRVILDAVSKTIFDANVPRMEHHLFSIEIAYYEKLGMQDELVRTLLAQHHASLAAEKEQNRVRQTSMELIDTMNHLRKQRRQLEHQAQTDTLTGIPNRLSMEKFLNESFDKALADSTRFAIEILDIDYFKDYNDFYGHAAGDECLRQIATAISDLAAEEDFLYARYGGDEFVLVFEEKSDPEILRIAEKLEHNIYDLCLTHEKAKHSDRVSISQGICSDIPKGLIKPWDFFSAADKALYSVKFRRHDAGDDTSVRLVNLS